MQPARLRFVLVFLVCALAAACGDSNGGGDDDGGDDAGVDAPTDAPPVVPPGCDSSGGAPQCNNCLDDDQDGTIDSFDIECTSAIDNDEGSFATGIPGDNMDATWQDCFFDGNSGGGDDGCRFNTCCMTNPTDPQCEAANGGPCSATQGCRDACAPLTPPNCDCFGCCTMCDDAGCVDIVINPAVAPNCDGDFIHDTTKCPVCVKSTACGTVCEGTTECGEIQGCPQGEYCLEGCCVLVPG